MSIYLGSHVSIAGGLINAAKEAASYNADTFMVYTGAPQNTRRQPIEKLKIKEGQEYMENHNLSNIVVHAPYIINLASCKEHLYKLAIDFFSKEINRTEALGSKYICVHPGAYTTKDVDYGIDRIANALNEILTKDTNCTICLETMAGKGSEIGKNFDELAKIIDKVNLNEKLGICFDTCHVHDSGYDIVNKLDNVVEEFDKTIGLDRIKVFHINGSLNPRGSRKDRHANIGADETNPKGKDYIGFDAIFNIVHHEIAQNKPLILETPWINKTTNLYKQEIELLRTGRDSN